MFRARIVFNGSLHNEYPFYSIAKGSEDEIREMLEDMKGVLVYAVSVQLQQSTSQEFPGAKPTGWAIVPSWRMDWTPK